MSTAGTDRFSVAVVQHSPVFLNLSASVEKACLLVEEAANGGAQVVVFPETWLPGYPIWLDLAPAAALWDHGPAKVLYRLLVENSLALPGPELAGLLAAARQTGTYIVMGAHERAGGTLYNTMLFIDRDGETFLPHRKLMPTYTERLVWGRGDGSTLAVLPSDYGVLGGLICWEHWMPLARAAMHAKGEILHVAQWPAIRDLHQVASRHYAFEGQCYVAAAGSVLSRGDALEGLRSLGRPDSAALDLLESMPGEAGDLLMRGGSSVIAPSSEYVVGPIRSEPGILYADVDPARVTEGHLFMDSDGHYSRPDVFHLEVNVQPQASVTFSRPQ